MTSSLPDPKECDADPETNDKLRIRYTEDEDLPGYDGPSTDFGLPLRRQRTGGSSYSTHSLRNLRSRNRSIDPAIALPIQYRTISFNVADSKERGVVEKKNARDKVVQDFTDLDWHTVAIDQIYHRLSSSPTTGLSDEGVAAKVLEFGPNRPSKPPSRILSKLFWYFFGGFGSLLFVGCILVFVSWKPLGQPPAQANLALAIVLGIVFLIQATFNAWQDFSSSRVMQSITGMLPEDCILLRNSIRKSVPAQEVVPGDVLFFGAGTKLPADIRFIEVSNDAKFDRSILTGESLPIAGVLNSTDENYLETRCIGLQGTHCTQGGGVGIVVSTGDRTVFGRIAKLTSTPSSGQTTLQKEILNFVLVIVGLMILMNIVCLAVWAGYIRVKHPNYMNVPTLIVDLVSIGIAFVPEGLPIAVTASLTITANVMKKNKILCKSLKTVETLGAVSVLLSDKTGTLTKNKMVATDCVIGSTTLTSEDAVANYVAGEENINKSSLDQLQSVAALCNAGEFDVTKMHLPLSERPILGDATDQALLRLAESLTPVKEARDSWRQRFDLAFNSKNKFAIRLLSPLAGEKLNVTAALSTAEAEGLNVDQDLLLTMKGAPDVLLGRCAFIVCENGDIQPLDDTMRANLEATKDKFSSEGKRVILLARKVLKASDVNGEPTDGDFDLEVLKHVREGLVLVGLVAIEDPPREEVPRVVSTLRQAGMRVMMVTGDFKLTALAIAQACGIVTTHFANVHTIKDIPRSIDGEITKSKKRNKKRATLQPPSGALLISGPELINLNEYQWTYLVSHYAEVVFARTTPEQKLRIVKEYKRNRANIVAMTGDGVNDAPSLKEADIGIAPGTASDIAIEAADMVLLDSDFGAIVEAVKSGRTVFDNLKKTIAYLLPAGSFSEFWPVMTSVVFGLPQVLSSFLMIIICCFTDCAAATVLAFEKPEADVMLRPPRDPRKERLVDRKLLVQCYGFIGLVETVCSFSMAFWYAQRRGVRFSTLWFSFGGAQVPSGMTQDEMESILSSASSVYFVNLVVMQWFSLMALRTRRLSLFAHPPISWDKEVRKRTGNWLLFPAIGFAAAVAGLFVYTGGIQKVVGSGSVPVEYWLLPVAFGVGLLCVEEGRKLVVRRWPGSVVGRWAW